VSKIERVISSRLVVEFLSSFGKFPVKKMLVVRMLSTERLCVSYLKQKTHSRIGENVDFEKIGEKKRVW